MEWRIELVAVPVSDVDRATASYTDAAGFTADHHPRVGDAIRGVDVGEVKELPWGSFTFSDPDGDGGAVQQLPARD